MAHTSRGGALEAREVRDALVDDAPLLVERGVVTVRVGGNGGTAYSKSTTPLTITGGDSTAGNGSLSGDSVEYWVDKYLAALNTTQLRAIETADIGAITTGTLAALGSVAVGSLTNAQLAALGSDQLRSLSATQVKGLTTVQLAAMGSDTLNLLTTTQVQALSSGQVAALTPAQLGALHTDELAALGTAQIRGISAAGIAAVECRPRRGDQRFEPVQIHRVAVEQIQAISPRPRFQPHRGGIGHFAVVVAERSPQIRDVGAQRCQRFWRCIVLPHVLNQLVRADDGAVIGEQHRQDASLLHPAERHAPARATDLHGAGQHVVDHALLTLLANVLFGQTILTPGQSCLR